MLLTLIIPAYNAATLARACRSALPTGVGLELLIVDDCSQDHTLRSAQQFANRDTRVRVLKTVANGGPGMARNVGIDAARGRWIGFLDADDEFAPNAVLTLLAQLTKVAGDTDVLGFDWRYADSNSDHGLRDDLPLLQSDADSRVRSYLCNRIDPSVIFHLYRRDFLNRHYLRFRSGYHEDVDFSLCAVSLAQRINVIPQVLYHKWNLAGSIVNTLSMRHIDGYFDAVDHIHAALHAQSRLTTMQHDFANFVVNVLSSRLTRLLRDAIHKTDTPDQVLRRLYQRVQHTSTLPGVELPPSRKPGQIETRYQKMFAAFMTAMPFIEAGGNSAALQATLQTLMRQSWSCYDLHHSLFLAPNEIRTCCKRYFYRGQMKGDVVLLNGGDNESFRFSHGDVLHAKQKLHHEINRNGASKCEGCPFLQFAEWGEPLTDGVKYLSMEYHSICNMRCTYCSPTYYGGQKARYNVAHVTASLAESGALAQCEYVVWGGGEPTLDKQFEPLARQLSEAVPATRQRVITNATKYLPYLAKLMAENRAFIVTSLDAGTEGTFQTVRKFKGLDRVLAHLQLYVAASAENTVIKYIALEDNIAISELDAFAVAMQRWQLLTANFQLSCDFRSEKLNRDEMVAIASLYHRLYTLGAGFVFLDDLIWQRLPQLSDCDHADVHAAIGSTLANPVATPHIAVWGTGSQARLMMQKSRYLQACEVAYFIDPRPQLTGTKFLGRPVFRPEHLQKAPLPVVIAAVQSAPFIHRQLLSMNLTDARVVDGLIL